MDKKKIAGIILVLAGIIIILFTACTQWSNHKKEKELIKEFEESLEQTYQEDEIGNIDPSIIQSVKNPEGEAAAIISIPKIDLEVAMIEGAAYDEDGILNYAVGSFEGSAKPGEKGNFAIAGHRNWKTGPSFFARADELEPGDKIYVKTRTSFCTYSITESFVVEATDTWVLDQTEEPIMTIVTCTIGGKQRLIIRAELEAKTSNIEDLTSNINSNN